MRRIYKNMCNHGAAPFSKLESLCPWRPSGSCAPCQSTRPFHLEVRRCLRARTASEHDRTVVQEAAKSSWARTYPISKQIIAKQYDIKNMLLSTKSNQRCDSLYRLCRSQLRPCQTQQRRDAVRETAACPPTILRFLRSGSA